MQYILLLTWHLLASLLPPFICLKYYIVLGHRMIQRPLLGHCTDYCVVYFYFT